MFSLLVKRLCALRGAEVELVFSLSWFSRWWRGADFILSVKWLALRAGQRQAGFFFEQVLALVARGMFFFWSNGLRSARARGREGCFESPLPTSGLHSPRNELRAARP